jgi:hypothetical protein
VDGEGHAFKLGIEYPSGSGKYTYQSSQFEAIDPTPLSPIRKQIEELNKRLPTLPDSNPYMTSATSESASPAQ